MEVGPAHDQLLAMAHAGLRGDDDAGAAEVGPPAQVDVVTVERDGGVVAAEGAEEVGPGEDARRREDEHVADRVVLLLVVLPRLGDRVDLAEPVEPEPDVLQHERVLPRHELGPDEPGVGAVQLLDEDPDGVGFERDVVVADAEEAGVTLDEAQHVVGGSPEPGVVAELAHVGIGESGADQRRQVVPVGVDGVAGQQEQRVQVGVVLVGQRGERLGEPGARTVDDDDRDDRRRERGVGFHGGARLPVRLRGSPSRTRHTPVRVTRVPGAVGVPRAGLARIPYSDARLHGHAAAPAPAAAGIAGGLVAVLAARIYVAGYGADNDTWLMLGTWDVLVDEHRYVPSRPPGYLLPELVIGATADVGGHWLSNLVSILLGTTTVVLLYGLLRRRTADPATALLLVAVLAVTPAFVIASTTSIDYVYGLCAFVAGWTLLESGRPTWLGGVAARCGGRLATGLRTARPGRRAARSGAEPAGNVSSPSSFCSP